MERIAAVTFTKTAKRLLVLMAVLVAMLAVAIPALAQEVVGPTQNEPAATPAQETSTEGGGSTNAASSEETPVRYVTFAFELVVEGEPPAGAAFAGH